MAMVKLPVKMRIEILIERPGGMPPERMNLGITYRKSDNRVEISQEDLAEALGLFRQEMLEAAGLADGEDDVAFSGVTEGGLRRTSFLAKKPNGDTKSLGVITQNQQEEDGKQTITILARRAGEEERIEDSQFEKESLRFSEEIRRILKR